MNFTAIDFETATAARDSACLVGIAVVRDGVLQGVGSWYIRPPRNVYDDFNTRLHGIGPHQTARASRFDEVFEEVAPYLDGVPVVAHNASFDMSVVRKSFESLGRPYPQMEYLCTLCMSRAHWPELPSHSLPYVLRQCDVTIEHHNALEDARGAAEVALRIGRDLGLGSIREAAKQLGVHQGELYQDWYSPCSGPAPKRSAKKRMPEYVVEGEGDSDHPFYDCDIAFTGAMFAMTRDEAMAKVAAIGGRPRTSVSRLTEYLVVGLMDYDAFVNGKPSSKLKKAMELQSAGEAIQIISEREFVEFF